MLNHCDVIEFDLLVFKCWIPITEVTEVQVSHKTELRAAEYFEILFSLTDKNNKLAFYDKVVKTKLSLIVLSKVLFYG